MTAAFFCEEGRRKPAFVLSGLLSAMVIFTAVVPFGVMFFFLGGNDAAVEDLVDTVGIGSQHDIVESQGKPPLANLRRKDEESLHNRGGMAAATNPKEERLRQVVSRATSVDSSGWPSLKAALPSSPRLGSSYDEAVGLQAYVISLPSRTDRQQRLAANVPAHLVDLGLSDINWWPAVPKTDIPQDLFWTGYENQTKAHISLKDPAHMSHYACLQSHLSLWQHHARHHPESDLFVLEDDARLPEGFATNLQSFVQALPDDGWEVLHLCADAVWNPPIALTRDYMEGGWRSRTTGYIVRKGVAAKLVELARKDTRTVQAVDQMLSGWYGSNMSRAKIRGFSPLRSLVLSANCDYGDIGEADKKSDGCKPNEYVETEKGFFVRRGNLWFSFCGVEDYGTRKPPSTLKNVKGQGWSSVVKAFCEVARCSDELVEGRKDSGFLFSCPGIKAIHDPHFQKLDRAIQKS